MPLSVFWHASNCFHRYVFLGLDTAVHAYSVATSCLFRILQPENGHRVIGYRLSPADEAHLYIFTATGSVSKWDWTAGKQVAHWDGNSKALSVESVFHDSEDDMQLMSYFVRECDGKREVAVVALGDKEASENVVLKSHLRISDLRVAREGQVVLAYGGPHILVGTANSPQSDAVDSMQYTWSEMSLPNHITSLDVRESVPWSQTGTGKTSGNQVFIDIAVGQADGPILLYHDIVGSIGGGGRALAPRRLHWHRGAVNVVRWSRDGMFLDANELNTTDRFRQLCYIRW